MAFGDADAPMHFRRRMRELNKKATHEDERLDAVPRDSLHTRPAFGRFDAIHTEVVEEEVQLQVEKYKRLASAHPAAAFRAINNITNVRGAPFKAPGATLLEQKDATLKHFKAMGGDAGGVQSVSDLGFRSVMPDLPAVFGPSRFKTGPITMEELQKALAHTASGRAPGVDKIPADVYKVPQVQQDLLDIVNLCYTQCKVPEEWQNVEQVPIAKKGDLNSLANWRPICLLPTAVKVYNRILLNRIAPGTEPFMRRAQSGFRRYRSVEEQQASLVQIISSYKRLKPHNYAMTVTFLDFAKAFPSTGWVAIRGALEAFQVPLEIINAVMSLYNEQLKAFVRTPEFQTDLFDIVTGTLQGDTLAPYLFVLVLDRVLDAAFFELQTNEPNRAFGIRAEVLRRGAGLRPTQAVDIPDLDFADDIALIAVGKTTAEVVAEAQLVLSTIARFAQRANLFLKPGENKTAIMVFGQAFIDHAADPTVARVTMLDCGQEKVVPIVPKYKYLGRVIDHAEHIGHTAISLRIKSAWAAFHKYRDIWYNPHVGRETKERFFDIFIFPCLTFSSTTWIATKAQLRRLDVECTRMRRYALQIPYFVPGDQLKATPLRDIYSRTGAGRHAYYDLPSTAMMRNSLRLLGHVLRQHDVRPRSDPRISEPSRNELIPRPPLYYLLKWEPSESAYGKRLRGGIRRNVADHWLSLLPAAVQRELLDSNNHDNQVVATMRGIDPLQLADLAEDRVGWRGMIESACTVRNLLFLRVPPRPA